MSELLACETPGYKTELTYRGESNVLPGVHEFGKPFGGTQTHLAQLALCDACPLGQIQNGSEEDLDMVPGDNVAATLSASGVLLTAQLPEGQCYRNVGPMFGGN